MEIEKVLEEAKNLVRPPEELRKKIEEISQLFLKACEEISAGEAKPILTGSFARDTWLPEKSEFDIFLVFDSSISRKELEEKGLEIGKKVAEKLGGKWRIEYAEHPYVRIDFRGVEIDIVPCFGVKSAYEIKSAVDRTPFHLAYLKQKLNKKLCDEIRLLKKFLKVSGLYGADAKTQGFSGYACELLILYYQSFLNLVKSAIEWKPGLIIDIENLWKGKVEPVQEIFRKQPLIIIDPVDKFRNVAAALSVENFYKFKKLCARFLENPSLDFFREKSVKPIGVSEFRKKVKERGTEIILIKFKPPKVVPDILWPQLRKFAERLQNILEEKKYEFKVLRKDVFTDEKEIALVLLEMEVFRLPFIQKRVGPPVFNLRDSERFLNKYREEAIVGPYVEGIRWCVEIRRKFITARDKLFDSLNKPVEILKAKGIPSYIAEEISKGFEILVGNEICKLIRENKQVGIFLKKYFEKERLV